MSGYPSSVTMDVGGAGSIWGESVRRYCASVGTPFSTGVVRSGAIDKTSSAASVVVCRGEASSSNRAFVPPWWSACVAGIVCLDECPLWQASRHARGIPVGDGSEWTSSPSIGGDVFLPRAHVSYGSWSHAHKERLAPDSRRWDRLRGELGIRPVGPWKFALDPEAPVVVVSRNPGGLWFSEELDEPRFGPPADNPLGRWIAEDDARLSRALVAAPGRRAVLRLHPRTCEAAIMYRTAAAALPARCSLEPPGVPLRESLAGAAMVDAEAGGTIVFAALSGVPALQPTDVGSSARSQIDASRVACMLPGREPVCADDMPDSGAVEEFMAELAAHSLSAQEVAEGRIWYTSRKPIRT